MTASQSADNALEEGTELQLDFGKIAGIGATGCQVVPVAVQDADSREVILIAYANQEALEHSRRTRIATFWSTSRNELWVKGASSGNTFDIEEIRVNCEQNSLVYIVRPKAGGICHTSNASGQARDCYYRRLDPDSGSLENLNP